MGFSLQQIAPAYPEIFLSLAAMALLMLGVFSQAGSSRMISWLAIAALVVALFLMGTAICGVDGD